MTELTEIIMWVTLSQGMVMAFLTIYTIAAARERMALPQSERTFSVQEKITNSDKNLEEWKNDNRNS